MELGCACNSGADGSVQVSHQNNVECWNQAIADSPGLAHCCTLQDPSQETGHTSCNIQTKRGMKDTNFRSLLQCCLSCSRHFLVEKGEVVSRAVTDT